MPPSRPLPSPSALTQPFWDAARNGTLVRPVCNSCGLSFFTPQVICPGCLSADWTYQPSSGKGTVYSATVVHRPPSPDLTAPYEIAIIDLEEGWSMLANIHNDTTTTTPIGASVEVVWTRIDDSWIFPEFCTIDSKDRR